MIAAASDFAVYIRFDGKFGIMGKGDRPATNAQVRPGLFEETSSGAGSPYWTNCMECAHRHSVRMNNEENPHE